MFKHILIPTDGSRLSKKAIDQGVALARALGARVTGVFAAPAPMPMVFDDFVPTGYMTLADQTKVIAKAAKKYLAVIEAAAGKAQVSCRTVHVRNDFPAEAILAAARKGKCDLIVMASHGRGGIKSVLLGSETHKVLVHSKVPVLVCR
jgi:nucleotide-binding universal stress UspA family protein